MVCSECASGLPEGRLPINNSDSIVPRKFGPEGADSMTPRKTIAVTAAILLFTDLESPECGGTAADAPAGCWRC